MPVITALYAGILGLISIGVSFAAGSLRGKLGVSIGDGGNKDLLLAMRRQANFVEYVPLALILIALLELNQVGGNVIHGLGLALVVGRIAHAVGIKADRMKTAGRFIGAVLTLLVTLTASIWLIATYF
jgi:uncharacterized membrane protein YecN with MAPEG domain